jgi:thiol:disulfide interchange protein DsbC
VKKLLVVMSLCFAGLVEAETGSVDAAVAQTILAKLQQSRADLEYGAVLPSPIPQIYQVQVTAGPLLYVTADGDYMFVGDAYQLKPGEFLNLGELARIDIRRETLKTLDTGKLIIFPAVGDTKAILNVFTDVDCGYCRKLHQEVPVLNKSGVEVRYLAFPRSGPGTESARRIAMAWCAKDQQKTLTDIKNGRNIPGKPCDDNPVEEHYNLGIQFGVQGTPALVLMDGTLIPGYRPASELLDLLGVR